MQIKNTFPAASKKKKKRKEQAKSAQQLLNGRIFRKKKKNLVKKQVSANGRITPDSLKPVSNGIINGATKISPNLNSQPSSSQSQNEKTKKKNKKNKNKFKKSETPLTNASSMPSSSSSQSPKTSSGTTEPPKLARSNSTNLFENTRINAVNGEVSKPKEQFVRQQLPIDLVETQLMHELASKQTIIVIGETGSGKSTQVPQLCVRAGLANRGVIAVTQPRRVAAVSLATRVATEMCCDLGSVVGYHVRFENFTSQNTKIEYMTDGIVLRKALVSPLLERYSTIIIDEAHERSLHSDVLMCILRQCQEQRKGTNNPLRLIIMSATLQAEKFQNYFNNAQVIVVSGRTFPIEVFYVSPSNGKSFSVSDYVHNAIVTVKNVHLDEPKGHDILVFLTGSDEIETASNLLLELNSSLPAGADVLMPVPLYAALRPDQQKLAFKPTPKGVRKVIISTNIAETSVTIPGIRVVIDSGKVKTKRFDAIDRIDVLNVHSVSKAQAKQRTGRAGRDAPGKCYRLYQKTDFKNFELENMPEILRCNLSSTFLELMKLGMKNPHMLKLIDPPAKKNVDAALLELVSLGAIRPTNSERTKYTVTEMGDQFCMYPIPPDHARILIQAQKEGCIMEAIKIVAAMQTESMMAGSSSANESRTDAEVERIRRRFETMEGDHITLLKIVLSTNHFFDQLNRKTEQDVRFGRAEKSLKTEYNQAIKKFCNDNFINEQHLKTASQIEEQLKEIAVNHKIPFSTCASDFSKVRKAIALGLFLNACEYNRQDDRYRLLINPAITLKIHPSSCLSRSKPAFIVFSELMKTTELYALQVTLIDIEWVQPLVAQYKKMKTNHIAESAERINSLIAEGSPAAKKVKLSQ